MKNTLFLFCISLFTFTALPSNAQSIELSNRTFWIGAPTHHGNDKPYFILGRIDWLEELVDTGPTLGRGVVMFEETYGPVKLFIPEKEENTVLVSPEALPAGYYLEDYEVYAPDVPMPSLFFYVPKDPTDRHYASCHQTADRKRVSLCVVRSEYPPDNLVRLKARLYFPPDPAERPSYYRDVAEKMQEVAACLDITGKDDLNDASVHAQDCVAEVIQSP